MKKVLFSFCLSLAGVSAISQAGSLDFSFGNNGIATIQVGVGNAKDNARAVAIQADGKILVGGRSEGPVFSNNFSVCRLNTNGSLDDQFDGDGKVIIPVGDAGGIAMAVIIQPDGKILVGGRGFYNDDEDFTVVRLMPGGTLDPNFGVGGVAHIGYGLFTDERFADMALQQDGKIVLAGVSFFSGIDGFFVARLDGNGIPDPGFGVGGKKIIQVNGSYWSEANSVAVQTDGKIVLGGISKNNTLTNIWNSSVVRLMPGGGPDLTFGTNNGEKTLETSVWNQCNSILLQPDGKILMAGVERNSSTQRDGFLIVRLTATGSLDDPFGVNGKLVLFQDVGGEATRARDMVLQPDGQIIVVGNLPLANGNACAAIRLTSGGNLDNSFDDDGIASLPTYEALAVALQADGRIVMATGPSNLSIGIDFVVVRLNGDPCLDEDGDTYTICSGDCDDNNANRYPGATEICNGIDDDCDGQIDEGVLQTFYRDADGDGFGNPNVSIQACTVPTGYVTNNLDCEDNFPLINPNTVWYLDGDNDGYYIGSGVTQCNSPGGGYKIGGITGGGDCNDANPFIHPGASEACNGVDDDCDGQIDEGVQQTFYRDADGDGWGDPNNTTHACAAPPGYVTNNSDCDDDRPDVNPDIIWYLDADNDNYYTGGGVTQCNSPGVGYKTSGLIGSGDCNDNNANINPGAAELCNGLDDNCSGQVDEGVMQTYYLDADDDDYYTGSGITQCTNPGTGYKTSGLTGGGDCNDNDQNINPGATEICNGIDDDCDGQIDQGLPIMIFYKDADGDGYGDPNISVQSCSQPIGHVTNNGDCDDTNDTIHPNATEYCNGIDENCNGIIDDNPVLVTWYRDADGDNWGNPNQTVQACLPPTGYIREAFDCDDTDPNINPEATEIDNDKDDNCDGQIDEDVLITYYRDADNDLFGDPSNSTQASTPPDGYVTNNTDCNDNNAAINPTTIWYLDADNDNYYTGNGITQCLSPGTGYKFAGLIASGDCNDNDPAIHPGATEICNSKDDDCNGAVDDNAVIPTWYLDADNDNYYIGAGITQCGSPGTGYKATGLSGGGDCNDNNGDIHPNAAEVCNGIDDNCNGQIDEGVKTTFYRDADTDGFGDPNTTTQACTVPAGYVTNNADCNDNNAAINPNTIWYLDFDNDNYYTGTGITQCISPGTGYKFSGLIAGGDCNDGNAGINPGATEVCNGIDDNCNGQVDEGVKTTFYRDADTDGFGDPNTTTQACTVPAGYVTNNTDCNDNNPAINPNTIWRLDADNDNYYTGTGITQCISPGSGYKMSGLTGGGDCNDGNASINPGATEVCGNNVDDNCNGQTNEGCPTTPTVSINDVTVYESDGQAVLTISLSQAVAIETKINFKTLDGTAIKGKDYKTINGSVSIAAGSLTAQVAVAIIPDNLNESSEFFDVQISLPKVKGQTQLVAIGDDMGRVTILNGVDPGLTKVAPGNITNNKLTKAGSENLEISVMPNPSQTDFILNITSSNSDPCDIKVFDINGRLVKRIKSASTHVRFGSDLIAGVYIVEVQQKGNKKTLKAIKL